MSDSVQNQTFQFSLSNGQVTAEQVVRGGHTSNVPIPSGATFTVGAGTVTETLTGAHGAKTILFTADAATPANYQVSSITETVTSPTTVDGKGHVHGTSFTIIDGKVTAEQEVSGSSAASTHSHAVRLDPAAQFTVNGSTVTETTVEGDRIETSQFVSSGSAGLYAVSSETTTFVPAGTATTHLSVDTSDRLQFTFGSTGSVATVSRVHADGTATAVTPDSHDTFAQVAPGFVVETFTHGSNTAYEVYHDGNGDGIYTEVAHGTGTLDLAGLQAQLIPAVENFV